MKTGLLYGIVPDTSTRVKCVFCGVFLPKASKSLEEHANGAKHKENMDLMAEHGISFNDIDHVYCKVCKEVLDAEVSVSKHIADVTHANWMATMEDLVDGEFIDLESYLSSEKNKEDVHCEACQCALHCNLAFIENHVNSLNHRTNVVEKLKPLNGIFKVDNDYEVWCKICNDYIENTVQDITNHIDQDDDHVDWFNDIEDIINGHDIVIKDYLTIEHENKARCNKCNVFIPCNLQSLEDHIITENHLNQFS